jgi:hypothetical protein
MGCIRDGSKGFHVRTVSRLTEADSLYSDR